MSALPATVCALALLASSAHAGTGDGDTSPRMDIVVGSDVATGRAATFRNAVALHDRAALNACPIDRASVSKARPASACEGRRLANVPPFHPFWSWLLRISILAMTLVAFGLSFSVLRTTKRFTCAMTALALLSIVEIAHEFLLDRQRVRAASDRTERAEWRWQSDLARASTLPDGRAGLAALDAARRYEREISGH